MRVDPPRWSCRCVLSVLSYRECVAHLMDWLQSVPALHRAFGSTDVHCRRCVVSRVCLSYVVFNVSVLYRCVQVEPVTSVNGASQMEAKGGRENYLISCEEMLQR